MSDRGSPFSVKLLAGVLCMLGLSYMVNAASVQHNCRQPTPDQLSCEYRFIKPNQRVSASLQVEDVRLLPTRRRDFSGTEDTVAVLILADTSDARR